ncbi:peptidoglycan bridge formation glycyltransferase FemA/FemB family protein [bacterium]|nr:peptidoglycan bridge formation glycyltransferase FemA/FemB family protein [bacterium]
MNFQLITQTQRDAWNAFIGKAPHGSVLQSFEWGEVKSGTWKSVYACATDDNGHWLAAALILKRVLPMGLSIFYIPRGPIFKRYDLQLIQFFFDSIRQLAKQEKVIVIKCDPEIPETSGDWINAFKNSGFSYNQENVQPRGTIILDIKPEPDELLKSFHHKTRYNIKLAEKKGVVVKEENSIQGIDIFYDLFKVTSERDQFMILHRSYFHHLWKTLSRHDMATVFVAYFDHKPLGAIFQTVFGSRMTYLYGASSNEHRNLMPNHLIHWQAILWSKQRGATSYDFWGIPSHPAEGHPLWGVYRFKKGFCETETKWIGTYECILNPVKYKLFTAIVQKAKTSIRFLKTGKIKSSLEE